MLTSLLTQSCLLRPERLAHLRHTELHGYTVLNNVVHGSTALSHVQLSCSICWKKPGLQHGLGSLPHLQHLAVCGCLGNGEDHGLD